MSQKNKTVTDLIKQINTRMKKTGPVRMMTVDDPELKIDLIRCNIEFINAAYGGGFANKCIHLLSGTPGAGKTATALSVARQAQKEGYIPVYVCTETPVNIDLLNTLGFDDENCYPLIVMTPNESGESVIQGVYHLLYDQQTNAPRPEKFCIVIDSINSLVSKKQIEKEKEQGVGADTMALRAKLLTDFFQNITGRNLLRNGSMIIAISQLRDNLSAGSYGPKDKISGGQVVQFLPKTICVLRKQKWLEGKHVIKALDQTIELGHKVTGTISKNNVSGVPGVFQYILRYEIPSLNQKAGADDTIPIFEGAKEEGIITKNGRAFEYTLDNGETMIPLLDSEEKAITKADDALDWLRNNPELKAEISKVLYSKNTAQTDVEIIHEDGIILDIEN